MGGTAWEDVPEEVTFDSLPDDVTFENFEEHLEKRNEEKLDTSPKDEVE